jgi:hypothetical protein
MIIRFLGDLISFVKLKGLGLNSYNTLVRCGFDEIIQGWICFDNSDVSWERQAIGPNIVTMQNHVFWNHICN